MKYNKLYLKIGKISRRKKNNGVVNIGVKKIRRINGKRKARITEKIVRTLSN